MEILRYFVFTAGSILLFSPAVFAQTAEPALEVLVAYPKVRDFTMTADGNEAYVTLQSLNEEIAMIAVLKKINGKWSEPQKASFSGVYRDLEASLAPDGLTLYFVSNRPLEAGGKSKDHDIWYVKRANTKAKWSAPQNLGKPVNSEKDEFYPSVAANGNMYFTREPLGPKNRPDILFSKWDGKSYAPAVDLGEAINTDSHEYNSFIAPDESFLIFGGYQREDGLGSGDMYISFRGADGKWSKAKNMGEGVNSNQMDFCPFVDVKTKTLYFTSRRSAITQKSFDSMEAFDAEVFGYENGMSRIYKISIADLLK
ncbi:MAG: PD40 domain-containing protein [Acidobacteria bacterium]|nr:PD40 domain-containing protein [Acidobacteriota bacterium]